MTRRSLLPLVDAEDFRTLFIEELGWLNPDRSDLTITVNGTKHTLTQVAGYKGLRIWHHAGLPPRKVQRAIDLEVGRESTERLLIFTGPHRQDWRWPRRALLGGANAQLVVHEHLVGLAQPDLERRLQSISIDLDEDVTLVELLQRMRDAFDTVSETASVQAARLMNVLYGELEAAGVPPVSATLTLARLLFLLFGDDTEMWRANMFSRYIENHTTADTLHADLRALFDVVDQPEESRALAPGSPLISFRYINGGLYKNSFDLPPLTSAFRDGLLEASKFDWGLISPAIFGSMFQTVKAKEARRAGGEHYTSEENILKTIGPLFLDEYRARLEAAWDDKRRLTELHNDLGRLRIMDPACGCGNFLIVAYRELRALELDLLKRRRDLDDLDGKTTGRGSRAQGVFDVTDRIKVTLDHFYGIEIEEWPARIAETAMLLVDHLANQAMEEEFGLAPDRLPIRVAPTIKHDNALRNDWAAILPPSDNVIILGNPPFSGRGDRGPQQTADQKLVWGPRYNINLDYVTCWYLRAIQYFGRHAGRWAFVSTNSVCQGEPVATLWSPILDAGWRCRFAHRSFLWESEARGKAAVTVSIVGFDRNKTSPKPVLWTYPPGGKGDGTAVPVTRINPYLIDGPNLLVRKSTRPLSSQMPEASFGSMPNDGGHLLVEANEYTEVASDPVASKYLRRFVGAKELVHNRDRWCLWMVDLDPKDLRKSRILRERVAAVRNHRSSSASPTTSTRQHPPHLFGQLAQPKTSYLAIPRHVSEHRRFYPAARFDADVICGDANFLIPDPDGLALAIVSSSMFMVWQKAIGGRIKSDLRFSKTFTYNTFPLPVLSKRQYAALCSAGTAILTARATHVGWSLARIYESDAIPDNVVAAHLAVDKVLDSTFGRVSLDTEGDRQRALFRAYAALNGQEAFRST
ncbi:class I SAM-dependent DNA methyltransferase [Actinopolymorpha singaporensis]|uniref:site-specific DNA-methyltransferase (adenine-specific) n=1 Tax=Actinopolymorpha singaporensis TaxID=117157 RepID=A0A1H1PAB0_9ACTN|nr:DNA methyltransferase [Actinopolymorpha singaporensis]SDS08228.1 Methyltransferase domain-containing protein [Actinopolymorpha singaporensis]